jgi:hydrocephalus-inducing protein
MIGAERKPKPVWTLNVFGNFITPSLMFNGVEKQREKGGLVPTKLDFKYVWEKNIPANPITKELVIKNSGPLPTAIMLKIDQPFSCPVDKLNLAKGQEESIKIDFDPSIQQNRCSDHLNGKLQISHAGHPHKDTVLLQGEVCFPNLQILPPNIDFGCILNDTGKKKYLTLTNISEMPVAYEWSFLEEAPLLNEQDEIDQANSKKKKKKKKQKVLPINEVFDILPVSGILQPHETENVEFTFYAGNGLRYQGMAVCSVEGGPDYDVPITGESSFVSYRLSTTELDFGEIAYNESISKDFFIENIGKVPFEFNINFGPVSRPGIIECSTMTGKVIEGEKFKVSVKFFPGIPDNIREMFLVECAHFPAERFTVKAVGIYPGCLLSFPRADQDVFEDQYAVVAADISQ